MYKDLKDIHIGKLIEARLKASGMSYAHFARKLNIDRTTVYSIVKSKSIDVERLIKISQILDYDFLSSVYFEEIDNDKTPTLTLPGSKLEQAKLAGGLIIKFEK